MSTAGPTAWAGPRVGELIPDFTVQTVEGRRIHRRDFKGRRHLVICFAHPQASDGGQGLLGAIAGSYDAYRAGRGEVLVVLSSDGAMGEEGYPFPVVADVGGVLCSRFGTTDGAALIIADRYGEVVVRVDSTEVDGAPPEPYGLPLATVPMALEWLETRCGL
jgi:peroxiredoxin